jgi:Flp pilus assembly protein TadB
MARTRQRRRKHRGTQAGTVRRPARASAGGRSPRTSVQRRDQPATWRAAFNRAGISAAVLLAVFVLVLHQSFAVGLSFAVLALLFYAPLFYVSDSLLYRRRQRRKGHDAG